MNPGNTSHELRREAERCMAEGSRTQAVAALRELWRQDSGPATASYVVACFGRLRPEVQLTPCRLALLRSFVVEPVVEMVRAGALLGGIDLTVQVGEFNAWAPEMLDAGSALYRFAPQVAMLAVETRSLAPRLWSDWADLTAAERAAETEEAYQSLAACVHAFRANSDAALVVHGLEVPSEPAGGVHDAQVAGQAEAIRGIDARVRELAASVTGVYMLDYDALVARVGRLRWHDERKWLTMRMPLAAESLRALALEWLRFLHPLTGRIAKVVVTDLDNTLWGGVIGEDGLQGIQVGAEHPGALYRSLQRTLLDIHRRGILLAVASKNNREDALDVLRRHPGMLLREEHFAVLRIDWSDKAASLREIAAELNVGLDSLVFVDDNPAERQLVRDELPEVTVVELPASPGGYAAAVRDCPQLERLTLSSEDAARSDYYLGQRMRDALQQSTRSLEEFYEKLAQQVEIAPVTASTLARAAQLTQKTNQFNLTTRRLSEAQLERLLAAPGVAVHGVRVTDRFGDNGMVGLCITRTAGAECTIDTLLLSCRVIGRTVEDAILTFLVEDARARGIRSLHGTYIRSAKNAPAAAFFRDRGFELAVEEGERSEWRLEIAGARVECPRWIRLTAPAVGEPLHA